jgi:hypothetical protein
VGTDELAVAVPPKAAPTATAATAVSNAAHDIPIRLVNTAPPLLKVNDQANVLLDHGVNEFFTQP